MDSFNALPIFVSVAQHGSFSAAARELSLSKSAVSKRITQLEEQLATRLIHRTTRKLSLTEAGERFFEHALQATQAAQNAEDAINELQGEPIGLLKIHVPMTFGLLHIAPLIPLFLKRYPKVNIELIMDDKSINLIEQGIDLSIYAGDLPDSNLIARKLTPLRSVICMAPSYHQQTALTSPTDLENENCLLYSYSPNAKVWQFTHSSSAELVTVKVKGNYKVNNSEALKEALLQGCGIGRLPSFVAGKYLATGELVQLFSDYTLPTKTIHAVYPERNYVPNKVRVFLDFAIEHFGKDKPYWDQAITFHQ